MLLRTQKPSVFNYPQPSASESPTKPPPRGQGLRELRASDGRDADQAAAQREEYARELAEQVAVKQAKKVCAKFPMFLFETFSYF